MLFQQFKDTKVEVILVATYL